MQLAPFTLASAHLQDLPMKLLSLCSKQPPLTAFTVAVAATNAVAKNAINVCGPDGPAPAIQKVARSFGEGKNKTPSRFRLTGGADVVFTRKGRTTPLARLITEFQRSPTGARIFANWA